jgi:hypothetical protein
VYSVLHRVEKQDYFKEVHRREKEDEWARQIELGCYDESIEVVDLIDKFTSYVSGSPAEIILREKLKGNKINYKVYQYNYKIYRSLVKSFVKEFC